MDDKIKKLWDEMCDELFRKDQHGDWPCKGVVMTEPWLLEVHSYSEAFEEHETRLDLVRMQAVKADEFDETALPDDLLKLVKQDCCAEELYPNVVSTCVYGDTLEHAIELMRQKLRLLDHGYILMDWAFYQREILNEDNGSWMLDDDMFDDDDDDDFDLSDDLCDEEPVFIDGVKFSGDKTTLLYFPPDLDVTEYIIPDGVEFIDIFAFENCTKLTRVVIPDSVIDIGNAAFRGCTALTEVVISNNVDSISECTFENCTALQEVVIPEGVYSIITSAFAGCSSLKNVVIADTVSIIDDDAFKNCPCEVELKKAYAEIFSSNSGDDEE